MASEADQNSLQRDILAYLTTHQVITPPGVSEDDLLSVRVGLRLLELRDAVASLEAAGTVRLTATGYGSFRAVLSAGPGVPPTTVLIAPLRLPAAQRVHAAEPAPQFIAASSEHLPLTPAMRDALTTSALGCAFVGILPFGGVLCAMAFSVQEKEGGDVFLLLLLFFAVPWFALFTGVGSGQIVSDLRTGTYIRYKGRVHFEDEAVEGGITHYLVLSGGQPRFGINYYHYFSERQVVDNAVVSYAPNGGVLFEAVVDGIRVS